MVPEPDSLSTSRDPLERARKRLSQRQLTLRMAARILMTVTTVIVVVAGFAMRLFDAENFDNIGLALWWSLQTVTTVGYGDAVPTTAAGRAVAAVTMLGGIAFLAILTAVITSAFIERARRERLFQGAVEADLATDSAETGRIDQRLTEIIERLDRVERSLGGGEPPVAPPPEPRA